MTDHDRLDIMFEAQRQLQHKIIGCDPGELEGIDRIQFIKDMVLAIENEMQAEILPEIGWKPWATSRHVNEAACQGEMIDIFHFFMNLCMVFNVTPEMLFEKYLAKREINLLRQAHGYDGVSDKCPICKRALDDEAVKCIPATSGAEGYCERNDELYVLGERL